MNTEGQPSLATLLYPTVADVRGPEEGDGDNNELLDYFHHDYVATEGDATASTSIPASAHDINGAPHAEGPAESVLPLPGTSSNIHGRMEYSRPTSTQREGRSYPPERASPSTAAAIRRSPSPPNPAVPIPPSLSQLASRVIPDIDLPDLSAADLAHAQEQALIFADYGERGEMGGKRRKQPHERAGWKEMDQQPAGKKRRTRKADQTNIDGSATGAAAAALTGTTHLANELLFQSASPQAGVGAPPTADMSSLTELSQMALHGAGPSDGVPQQSAVQNKPSLIDPTLAAVQSENKEEEDVSKLSRAEQNKRAQQAFRRRREEHMKKLEMDSAQLEIIKRQLTDKDATLRDLLLTVESSKIEIAALQTVIKRLVPLCRASPLSVEGQLVVDEDNQVRAGVLPAPNDLDEAFVLLGKQSRELAKQDRKRRQEE